MHNQTTAPKTRRHRLRSLARSRSGIRRELYWQATRPLRGLEAPAVIEYRDSSPLSMPQVITGRPWPPYSEIRKPNPVTPCP